MTKKNVVTKTPAKAAKKASAKKTAANAKLPFAPKTPARPFVDLEAVQKKPATTPTAADVQKTYKAPTKQSKSNVLGDPTQNLQTFELKDLALFTKEATFSTNASKDVHLFYVGRDDVHDILKYILSRVTVSLYLNMFGFDDSELNNILMQKALNPAVTMLITLDQSQAGGVHEKALLEADQKYNLAAYNTHFVIGQSLTHQISHTKGFVADGRVAAEGSTNWSASGEGTFVVNGQAGGPGYKAQNNTQSVITDPDTIVRFQTELITEHMIAQAASKAPNAKTNIAKPLATEPTPATKALQTAAAKSTKKAA
jgi:PLD-like domain